MHALFPGIFYDEEWLRYVRPMSPRLAVRGRRRVAAAFQRHSIYGAIRVPGRDLLLGCIR